MPSRFACRTLLAAAGLLLGSPGFAADAELEARARGIHERVMTLDTHVDIELNHATSEFMPADGMAQVNLDMMRGGGLDAAFFIVFVPQTARTDVGYLKARADALAKFDAIHRMV